MKITSVNNELIKSISKLHQRKYRDLTGQFLLEGDKCIDEALEYGIEIKHILVIEGYDKYKKYTNVIEVSDNIMSKITTTDSPPKAIAIGYQRKSEWSRDFKKVILLEDIKDAGNLGTIIRTACAFNIDAIILFGNTVDLYNPKCVRASVGNLWKIPVFNIKNTEELYSVCSEFIPISTLPKHTNTSWLKDFIAPQKSLIMFGTESSGLSKELKEYAEQNGKGITIEMSEKVESLNLSISVGIILYSIFN